MQEATEVKVQDATVRVKSAIIVVAVAPARTSTSRRNPRTAVLVFFGVFLALNFGLRFGMDYVFPTLRDPEYGRRLSRLNARLRENSEREFFVMLGSSRTAMGLRPTIANDEDRVLFNFAQVGSGPVMQLLTLRRLLQDGVTPKHILLEYWPPFLREDGTYAEEARIDKHRLRNADEPFIRDYFEQTQHTLDTMKHVRVWPWYEHRLRLLSQIQPNWLTYDRRQDGSWAKLDDWGWLPGYERDPTPEERDVRHQQAHNFYSLVFRDYQLHPTAERATRELLTICRDRGISVSFVWLPESSEFRSWYTNRTKQQSEAFLTRLHDEFGTRLIDAREWVPDVHLADGFHLTQPGAIIFSQKLRAELWRQP